MEGPPESFAHLVRRLAVEYGNQSALGRRCGLRPQRISAWSRGESLPNVEDLYLLARGTRYPVAALVARVVDADPGDMPAEPVRSAIAADQSLDRQARRSLLTSYAQAVDATEARRGREERRAEGGER